MYAKLLVVVVLNRVIKVLLINSIQIAYFSIHFNESKRIYNVEKEDAWNITYIMHPPIAYILHPHREVHKSVHTILQLPTWWVNFLSLRCHIWSVNRYLFIVVYVLYSDGLEPKPKHVNFAFDFMHNRSFVICHSLLITCQIIKL